MDVGDTVIYHIPLAYLNNGSSTPEWLNKGDNAWQMICATLIGLQSMPGLVVLYGSIVKKKWAVNSAFMALYAFAATLICWVIWGYKMAFGEKLLPFWGKAGFALTQSYLTSEARLPASVALYSNGTVESHELVTFYPMAAMVTFHFSYAAITIILLCGSVLGRMNILAWMIFVPLWLTFSYTVGAFSLWGGGFLYQWGVIDYSGGYVIHVSSGTAGFVAAYLVGPRLNKDRERFPPNNILLMLTGAGLLWMGWAGFNGGSPYQANVIASIAILNTHICASTSLLIWTTLDVIFFGRPSVIGAVQGMITGLVVITPGAGLVQPWSAIIIGAFGGIIPWFTMMVVHKRSRLLMKVDDALAVFHTHTVAGILGGFLTGLLAEPTLCSYFDLPVKGTQGAFYAGGLKGLGQLGKQLGGALFVIGWNILSTILIIKVVSMVVPLRMSDEQLLIGDDAVHGEEAYALWGDGEKLETNTHSSNTNNGHDDHTFWHPHAYEPRTTPEIRNIAL